MIRFAKKYLKKIYQKLRVIYFIIYFNKYKKTTKVVQNKIAFLSDSRKDISGNFEFVYEKIDKKKYEIETFLKPKITSRKTLKERKQLARLIATSKYIFLDDFYPMIYPLTLKPEQELIQLWHAMGAFKKIGFSRTDNVTGNHSLSHHGYTGVIVSSEGIRKDYAEAFNCDIDKVLPLGIPRTDIFFDKNYAKNIRSKLFNKNSMLKNKKVILFAPTFRGFGQKTAHYPFEWIDFKRLKRELKDEYVCIIKLHPFIKNRPDYDFVNDDFYIDLTYEREINDLLFITDVLVTDYSSVIFEYSFFEKPVVFFVPDLKEYQNGRDFYYPINDYTYGTIAKNQKQLIEAIKSGKVNKEKLKKFKKYFCSSCEGHSTENIIDYFLR